MEFKYKEGEGIAFNLDGFIEHGLIYGHDHREPACYFVVTSEAERYIVPVADVLGAAKDFLKGVRVKDVVADTVAVGSDGPAAIDKSSENSALPIEFSEKQGSTRPFFSIDEQDAAIHELWNRALPELTDSDLKECSELAYITGTIENLVCGVMWEGMLRMAQMKDKHLGLNAALEYNKIHDTIIQRLQKANVKLHKEFPEVQP